MNAVNSIETLIEVLTGAVNDATKHDKGVDAAGARLRKKLQSVASACKNLRAEVQDSRNSRK